MFPITDQLSGGASPLLSALMQRFQAGPQTSLSPQPFMPIGQGFGPAAHPLVGGGAPAPAGLPVGPIAAAAPGGPQHGPAGDGSPGYTPPWPGAVVAVYDHGRPIFYGTPEWQAYQWQHGGHGMPAMHGAGPLVEALLSRFHPAAGGHALGLGHGPVL